MPPLVPLGDVPGLQAGVTSAPTLAQAPNPAARAMPAPGIGLSQGGPGGGPIPPQYVDDDDGLPPLPPDFKPVVVTSTGDFIPEIGGSMTTALWENYTMMAQHIVQMMEKPW